MSRTFLQGIERPFDRPPFAIRQPRLPRVVNRFDLGPTLLAGGHFLGQFTILLLRLSMKGLGFRYRATSGVFSG